MFERIRQHLLRLLRVPPEPEPPAGAPGSLRVFRGGRNLYKLRLFRWSLGQLGAAAGIVFSLAMIDRFEASVRSIQTKPAPTTAAAPAVKDAAPASAPADTPAATETKSGKSRKRSGPNSLQRITERWPAWVFPVIKIGELGAIVLFFLQLPLTYAMVRLDFELRWYLVTDRSLRIRSGLTRVQESTMSFANLQQVVVTQGPVQRLLGIADVRVQSAGGGGDKQEHDAGDSLHTVVFHGVENAPEIRDLILDRLRRYRETGLGDPDEMRPPPAPAATEVETAAGTGGAAVSAARALLAEARALRRHVG